MVLPTKTNPTSSVGLQRIVPPKILSTEEMTSSLLAMPSMVETKEKIREKILLYGDPFTGKTTLAALMSEFYYLLWFDGDNGLSAIKNNLPTELHKRIIPIVIPANTAFPIFMHTMLKVLTGRQVSVCADHGSVACPLCKIENGNKIATFGLDKLPANWIAVMDNQTQFAMCAYAHAILKANPKEKDTPIDYKMERDDWGMGKTIMDKEQAYLKDLSCNFITISHLTMVEMEDKKKKIVPVGGSDPVSRQFAKNFDHQVYCQLMNLRHHYASATTFENGIQTGSRSGVALEKCITPSLLHFFKPTEASEMLKGSYNEWFLGKQEGPEPKPKEIING